jgi:hypothetical protein
MGADRRSRPAPFTIAKLTSRPLGALRSKCLAHYYKEQCCPRSPGHLCARFMTIEDTIDDDRTPRWCPLADGMQADLASIGA